jgi:hypothetical protein
MHYLIVIYDIANTQTSKPWCRVKVVTINENNCKNFGFHAKKWGLGQARAHAEEIWGGGPEPVGPIQVYAYIWLLPGD